MSAFVRFVDYAGISWNYVCSGGLGVDSSSLLFFIVRLLFSCIYALVVTRALSFKLEVKWDSSLRGISIFVGLSSLLVLSSVFFFRSSVLLYLCVGCVACSEIKLEVKFDSSLLVLSLSVEVLWNFIFLWY
jgi:hypothetical protein